MITIRTAVVEDHNEILKVAKQSKYTKDFSNTVMFSSPEAYAKGWIRVAEEDGKVVGFTCIREKVRQPETVLYFITVDKDTKGKGVGKLLIQDIIDRTRHNTLALNVAKDNAEAKQFYDTLGFVVAGESLAGKGWALRKSW